MVSASKLFNALLAELGDRQKEVVSGRFGLGKSDEAETLAAIGDRLGITRERVRQIESSAVQLISKKLDTTPAAALIEKGKKYLKASGGVAKKDLFLGELGKSFEGLHENHLALLIEASREFGFYGEDKDLWSFYYLTKNDFKNAVAFIDAWTDFIKEKKIEILGGGYHDVLKKFAKAKKVGQASGEAYLSISRKIHTNPYGDTGHRDWVEIKPMTIRDQIYLVLKKTQAPLHFEDIAKKINEVGFGKQPALAPTVHNELIKDQRFVLVGRGIYALRENGYEPGTAKEVIAKILKEQGPLPSQEVVLSVQKARFFKPNTVLINLQNKKFFERLSDGRYRVRES